MAKKKKDIYRLAKYRVRFDHVIDGQSIYDKDTEADAFALIRKKLKRYPYVKANLKTLNKQKDGYKHKSSWMFRKRKTTGKYRLVRI